MPRLTDPWFDATFIKNTTESSHRRTNDIVGADGVFFWCPCGYGKPEFPLDGGRPHGVIVSFSNPFGCAAPEKGGSQSRDGKPSRWNVSGTGLHDLTLSPSIAVGIPECWHGHVVTGEVR